MKKIVIVVIGLIFILNIQATFAQSSSMSPEMWEAKALMDIRMLPKYGNKVKTQAEKDADISFINQIMSKENYKDNREKASEEFIKLGFSYISKDDLRGAMSRFNQAYLLDSNNTDIYWGFGSVYLMLGDFQKAKEQFEEGLRLNPNNKNILTDMGTYYMLQAFYLINNPDYGIVNYSKDLNLALDYLMKSYKIDPTNPTTLYKLSSCYLDKGDCENSKKYFEECKKYGEYIIQDDFKADIEAKCK